MFKDAIEKLKKSIPNMTYIIGINRLYEKLSFCNLVICFQNIVIITTKIP